MMATEPQLQTWTAASGRDWNQLCQAWCWNICDTFGSAPIAYGSALDAYYATPIVSTDVYAAPPGACVFYDIGAYGHVSFTVDNDHEGMGSSRVSEEWGINAGETDLADYLRQTGAYPLGWGWTNGANSFPFEPANTEPTPPPIDYALLRRQKEPTMYFYNGDSPEFIYNAYTDANGAMRIRLCEDAEAAFARAGGLAIPGDAATVDRIGKDGHYREPVIPEVTIHQGA